MGGTSNFIMKPILLKPIKSLTVKQRMALSIDVHTYFSGDTLTFSLVGASPRWLFIESTTGIISGETPAIVHTVQYLVKIKASNPEGDVIAHFLLKVSTEDFITSMTSAILNLTRTKTQNILDHHRSTHEILEYIFNYYRLSKEWKIFEGLIREEASHMNIRVANPISYAEYREIVLAKNPTIESTLHEQLDEDHLLIDAEMQNDEMENLFRQGSQPQGSYPRQVWNYLGAPSLYNLSHVKTVLRQAAEAVIEQFENTQKHELQHEHLHRPELSLHPKEKGLKED